MLLLNVAALLYITTVSAHFFSPQKEKACHVEAWVRAEDLSPNAIANGDLRVQVNPSCTEKIASVVLQLQFDEFSEVKFLCVVIIKN